jgi:5-methylcytosine-specific restriction protein A
MDAEQNIIRKNESRLKKFHFVSAISKDTDYWGGIRPSSLEKYHKRYGDDFNVIIYDSTGSAEFYSIPYSIIKSLLTFEIGYLPNQRRWQYSIQRHILQIHGSDEQLDVQKYFKNTSNIPQLGTNENTNSQVDGEVDRFPPLNPGQEIQNDRLCEIFKCSPQMGMRRSKETNTLVLVSNHTRSIYNDRWEGDIFHYTGMGLVGDQSLSSAQNRTLNESRTNGVQVFLFEVFQPRYYTYIGEVELAGEPYSEQQPDQDGTIRDVWVFPLRLKNSTEPVVIDESSIRERERRQTARARAMSVSDLLNRAMQAQPSERRIVRSQVQTRDAFVAEYARKRANGICQLCEQPAPFRVGDTPFLEVHHVIPLSENGPDTIENTVALCPNCHRRMHALKIPREREQLKIKAACEA